MGHEWRPGRALRADGVLHGRLWSLWFLTTFIFDLTGHATAKSLQNHSATAVFGIDRPLYKGTNVGPVSNATVASAYHISVPEEDIHNASSWQRQQHQQQHAPASAARVCVPPSIDEFPRDPFTAEQRQRGWLAVHFVALAYLCCMLAIVCDEYFVPCLELLSDALKISSDVAGATVMAVGTSSPELYSAIIGSFVTEGDIGVGAIVGSAVFNILGVTSVTGIYLLCTTVQLEWYPIVRDCLLYVASVSVLATCIADSTVYWYEAASLLLLFCVYVLVMHYNPQLKGLALAQMDDLVAYIKSEKAVKAGRNKGAPPAAPTCANVVNDVVTPLLSAKRGELPSTMEPTEAGSGIPRSGSQARLRNATERGNDDCDDAHHPTATERRHTAVEIKRADAEVGFVKPSAPSEAGSCSRSRTGKTGRRGCLSRTWWLVSLPASLLLRLTVPDCRRWPRLYPLTFVMAVVWIGLLSYLCAWMVTIIGYTLNIPDSVSGLTILAAGISVPEIITTVLIVKMGCGNMAFSNLIGSNIFDILFCLGMPWLIKTLSNSGGQLHINSGALTYTTLTLLGTTVLMLVTLCAARWRLNWRVGLVCLALYVAFLTLACCYELNYFGNFNPPTCRE